MDSRYASRKFILASALVLYAMICNALGIKPDPQWLSFIASITGLYIAGNVGSAFVAKAS